MAATLSELILQGKLEEAGKVADSLRTPGRKDLSTQALEADIRSAETEQRKGLQPSFALTKSGQFGQGEEASTLAERLKARRGVESAQDRTLDREDKRLNTITKQFAINAKFKREELNNKVDSMIRAINKEKSPEARVGILSKVLDSYTKILQTPEIQGDRRESLQQISDAISQKLFQKTGQLE